MNNTPNRLIKSTSPYLLQHAYNPVNWYEWGEEALEKAKNEDKPILVSIGYSACHWCHVMERESFENQDIAQIMNEYFVCIKVDREERPDVDQVYMEAIQVIGMNGGWPLNVFITPDQVPFYGGTYFPPPNWAQLLININKAFKEKRPEIESSAAELRKFLNESSSGIFSNGDVAITRGLIEKMFKELSNKFDGQWGGLDKAPKFIMPSVWQFLLRYHYLTSNQRALAMVELTLLRIAGGGIYDQLAGGFARYSVDGQWFAPHFEKMLYDNAQLLSLYTEAWLITKNQLFKKVIEETVRWTETEMTATDFGFYSALDADSEGEEGKFYCWTHAELKDALGPDTLQALKYFQCKPEGNWEHGKNILLGPLNQTEEDIAAIESIKKKLLTYRSNRIRPGLDDKKITAWNAMMVKGLIDAGLAFQQNDWLNLAVQNMLFIETKLMDGKKILRSYKDRTTGIEGFLDDYAYVIQAYLALYGATYSEQWLEKANSWTNYILENFYDPSDGYFFYTSSSAQKLIARKKELFDNVIPSSNSLMASNLLRLGQIKDDFRLTKMASLMIAKLSVTISESANYMSNWGIAMLELLNGYDEVVTVGEESMRFRNEFSTHFLPFAIFMGTVSADTSSLPLMKGKTALKMNTTIYVCKNKTCRNPVFTVHDALAEMQQFGPTS